jgi:plastocyanin
VRRASALVLAAALALVLAACGGSDNNAASSSAKPATGGSGEAKVSMKNIKFVPMDISAKVGQKITWTNDDPVAHTVTAQKGADFDSGTVNSGGTFSFTPKKAGTIDYVCTIHPGQTGTITVTR